MKGPPVAFSRNMVIVREGERLVLVNAVRLDDAGLASLDALGKVTDVIRLAAFHGMDDPFYKERYGAKVWTVAGQPYTAGFEQQSKDVYLEPDVAMEPTTELPIAGARLYTIRATPPEGILLLPGSGGIAITGDCLQNWAKSDEFFNLFARVVMPFMGFLRPYNVGPAWLKNTKPPKDDLQGILKQEFGHVLPAHGAPVIGGARESFRPALERAVARP